MQSVLSDNLRDKYIICSCEGTAEETIINLLLDNEELCFKREDLVDKSVTRYRTADEIAREFLNREYEREITILRIIDRANDIFKLPKVYTIRRKIEIFDIVTKPEIEILHIISKGLREKYEHEKSRNKQLKPSSFCKAFFRKDIKTNSFVEELYSENIDKLISAIKYYSTHNSHRGYNLNDLLNSFNK